MNFDWQYKWFVRLVLLLTLVFFGYKAAFFLNNDFWQDEIYTLHHFVFVPWRTVLTDYHSTNNHIVFNVLVKAIAGLLGVQTLPEAIATPYVIRLIPLSFAVLSAVVFFLGLQKYYGRPFALVGVSFLCTSIVFVDFSVQARGYSLSILFTTLLFFTLLKVVNRPQYRLGVIALFFLNALNLLCLPTNIYISLSLLLLCFVLIAIPAASLVFFNKNLPRFIFVSVAVSIAMSTVLVLLYYRWLLQMQPENPLISSFKLMNIRNAVQALAVFYHFADYKFYVFGLLLIWLIAFLKKGRLNYSAVVLPAFLFFAPFLFFFIHGAIIIQRTFLPLLPFFAMIMAAVLTELAGLKWGKRIAAYVPLTNILVLTISFNYLLASSKQNNRQSVHEHDLRNHYYLVNFNAREVALAARQYAGTRPVLVWDDYGGTGICYYLESFRIPFVEYNGQANLEQAFLLLTNNKAAVEPVLRDKQIPFKKLLGNEKQYTIYLLGSAD